MSYLLTSDSVYGQVCAVFQLLAQRTWSDLENGNQVGLEISEESITDFLLLDLTRALPDNIFVKKFSKTAEGKTTGADWEWWFIAGNQGFGMRIQAKRLSIGTSRYKELKRRAGKNGGLQVDLLLKDARRANLYPAYCFYNCWDSGETPPGWNCRTFPPNWRLFGCAIADAWAIKALVSKGQDDLRSVGNVSLPWSCLVCCQGFAPIMQSTLPYRVRGLLSGFGFGTEGVNERFVPDITERGRWPHYVSEILETRRFENFERPAERDIDGVVVIRA